MTTRSRSKYGNVKTTDADGVTFDSLKERRRWAHLQVAQRGGVISNLRRQVRYPLHAPGGIKVCDYIADHVYEQDGATVVEDVKSEITRKNAMYRLKRRWMLAEYQIHIKEV